MKLAVTRPLADAQRTAAVLRSRGHEPLIAPLAKIEPVNADLSGEWSGIAITSANALLGDIARFRHLPLYAVGDHSAHAARDAGFDQVMSADGDANDLAFLISRRHRSTKAPLLYLSAEHRAFDLEDRLAMDGINAKTVVVYRAADVPFPANLAAALKEVRIDGVLHYSRRAAELYMSGARAAGVGEAALRPKHYCLSARVAEPLAGGVTVVTPTSDETALLALVDAQAN